MWGMGCGVWKKTSPETIWDTSPALVKTIVLGGVTSPFQDLPYTPHPTPYTQRKALDTDHRADVVMGDTVIEFKRYLSTSKIYQARGQAENYSDAFGCKKIWLVGCLPQSHKAADAAIRLANSIHTNTDRVRVIFIDIDA